ncbi:MAG TPA: response regulator transcription factor [Chloroflexia bacterium]|nr:response regulator transcription factor [Chloroflexia bacterium]
MSGFLSNSSNTPSQKIRLLVAEDSQGTRHNLINLLGFEKDIEVVGAVGRALQAIEMANQLRPHVVLMDINLPDLDGLTATMRIRASIPGIAVIIMSVQDEESYMRRALQAGASAFLVKPFSGDELVETIRKVAGR